MSTPRFLIVLLLLLAAAAVSAANAPVIVSIDPPAFVAGTASSLNLTVNGANFTSSSIVRLDGGIRTTNFISSTKLSARMNPADLTTPHVAQVTVTAGSLVSSAVPFQVLPNDPQIAGLDPATVSMGGPDFTMRVNGANFATTAVVRLNGSPRDTTYIDDHTLDAVIRASDITTARTVDITVANPNAHVSDAARLTIVRGPAGPPTITTLSPNQVTAKGPSFTLTIIGRNFDQRAVARLDSAVRQTTFIDSGHLTITVPETSIVSPGTLSITVTNPDNSVSAPATVAVISDTLPILDTIAPTSVRAGSGATLITANGSHFTSASVIRIDGVSLPTNLVSSNRLTATIPGAQTAVPKTIAVTVLTPGRDGGESAPQPFVVTSVDAPAITSLTPPSFQVGATQRTFLVNGGDFTDTDKVLVGGTQRPTTFIGTNQLSATLEAADVASAGDLSVTVRKQNGAASAPFVLHVTQAAAPVIDALNPATASLGDPSLTLVITGRNFISGSLVSVDGQTRDTLFVSATQLTASLIAADLATPRNLSVVVTTPSGATSAPVELPVVVVLPIIDAVDPTSVAAGDANITLSVTGRNFGSGASLNVNGQPRPTNYFSSTNTLSTVLAASDLSAPGTVSVTVTDRGVTSAVSTLTVVRPSVAAVDPNTINAGSNDTTVTVTGSAFVAGSTVTFKGGERATTFVSPTTLTAVLPASALGEPGTFALNVRNSPDALSLPFTISVVSPGNPRIDSITPTFVPAGTASVNVRILGANFVQGAQVRVNGTARETRFVSGSELGITFSGAELATARTLSLTVADPAGVVSNAVPFTITSGAPPPAKRRSVGH